jgi:exoribonuclease R
MISMLPEPFNSIFCALRAKHESLTISISFQVDEEGNVQEVSKVARSIINPPFAFSHEQLERVLAGEVAAEVWRGWDCGCRMESEYKAISGDIRLLHQLISKRRQRRIDSGGLAFEISVKSFQLA